MMLFPPYQLTSKANAPCTLETLYSGQTLIDSHLLTFHQLLRELDVAMSVIPSPSPSVLHSGNHASHSASTCLNQPDQSRQLLPRLLLPCKLNRKKEKKGRAW